MLKKESTLGIVGFILPWTWFWIFPWHFVWIQDPIPKSSHLHGRNVSNLLSLEGLFCWRFGVGFGCHFILYTHVKFVFFKCSEPQTSDTVFCICWCSDARPKGMWRWWLVTYSIKTTQAGHPWNKRNSTCMHTYPPVIEHSKGKSIISKCVFGWNERHCHCHYFVGLLENFLQTMWLGWFDLTSRHLTS